MSDSSPKRFEPAPSQPADADFNWPPTDEELADSFYSGLDEQLPPRGVEVSPETVSDGFNRPPADSGKSEVENPAHYGGSDDSTTSDIAVFTHEAALAGGVKNEWSAEIARLQASIEALTEKVEWRIPNDTRR